MSESLFCLIEQLKEEKKAKQYLAEVLKLEVQYFEQAKKIEKAFGLCQAIMNGEEYTKDNFSHVVKSEERTSKIETAAKAGKRSGPKPKKGDSQQLSFDLYKQGKNIEQIAKERGLALTTIEGHLAEFVKAKKLKATDFVSEKKIQKIQEAAASLDTISSSAIKGLLGDEFSYADIRFALASMEKENVTKELLVKD